MKEDERIRSLLVRILTDLSQASTNLVTDEETCCETYYTPEFRWTPIVSLTDDDRELIRQLAEEEGEDFSTLTDL